MATNGDATMAKRRIGGLELTVKADDADFYSEKMRRERAYQWHARWAMPNYDKMKENVRKAPGLDITEADVDLLPWGKDRRLDRKEYVKIQNGTSTRDTSKPIKDFEQRDEAERLKKEAERLAEEEERRRKAEEEERRRKAAEEAARRLQEAEEARRRKEEEERLRREEEERRRREEEERRRREEEEERRRREEEERRRREEEERRRREEEERRRREEEERRRREEEERRRREEEERRRREEEERLRREEEERRRLEEIRRREEAERKRLEEERRRAEEEERRRLEEERRRAEEEERRRRAAEEAERLRREPPPVPNGDSPVERAYRTFDLLARPTRDTMKAATQKTEGLEIVEEEVDVLPWTADGKNIDYAKLRDMIDKEKRRRQMEDKIIEMWKKYERPNKEQFKEICRQLDLGISEDDVSLVTWDEEDNYIIERDDDEAEKAKQRRNAFQRRKIEEEERRRRKAQIDVVRMSPKKVRPPPIPIGNSPIERAYRWYSRLSGPVRETFIKVVKTESMDITEADVDLLPWIKKGAILDFGRLKELLDIEDEKRKALLRGKKPEPKKEEGKSETEKRRDQAYHWYKLLKRPKMETMYRLIDETIGMDITKSDIDLLPWNSDRTSVKEDEL